MIFSQPTVVQVLSRMSETIELIRNDVPELCVFHIPVQIANPALAAPICDRSTIPTSCAPSLPCESLRWPIISLCSIVTRFRTGAESTDLRSVREECF
jgi:hypothetical protein